MKNNTAHFDFDSENDQLAIYFSEKKSDYSVECENVVIDFDSQDKVVGIEFTNATTLLSAMFKRIITKQLLATIKKAYMQIREVDDDLAIFFTLVTPRITFENEVIVPLHARQVAVV